MSKNQNGGKVKNKHILFLFVLIVFLLPVHSNANTLVIKCEPPEGKRFNYSGGELNLSDARLGKDSNPTFWIDTENPSKASYVINPSKDKTKIDAEVIKHNDTQITIIGNYPQAVWLVSLFPKVGVGYITIHKNVTKGEVVTSSIMFSKCLFTRE